RRSGSPGGPRARRSPASTRSARSPVPAVWKGSTTRPWSCWLWADPVEDQPFDLAAQQLVELLELVSSFSDEASAAQGAVERAAQVLEAEVAAVVIRGRVLHAVSCVKDLLRDDMVGLWLPDPHDPRCLLLVSSAGLDDSRLWRVPAGEAGAAGRAVLTDAPATLPGYAGGGADLRELTGRRLAMT